MREEITAEVKSMQKAYIKALRQPKKQMENDAGSAFSVFQFFGFLFFIKFDCDFKKGGRMTFFIHIICQKMSRNLKP